MNPEEFDRLLSRFEDASVALHTEGTASAQERWHAAGDAIRAVVQEFRDAEQRLIKHASDEHVQGWSEAAGFLFGMAAAAADDAETLALWRAAERVAAHAKELRAAS